VLRLDWFNEPMLDYGVVTAFLLVVRVMEVFFFFG